MSGSITTVGARVNKEPLRLWFPELNSYQIGRLRKMLKEAYEQGKNDA